MNIQIIIYAAVLFFISEMLLFISKRSKNKTLKTGNDKMSPYFFGGVLFGKGSYEENWANAGQDLNGDYMYDATIKTAGITAGSSSFGWTLGAGLDYYVAENLYLGLEMGLQSSSVKYTDVTTDITFADNTTMKIIDGPSKLGFTSLGAAHGSIRIGWRF